jgi:mono/diheme cytochrome c family protein
MFPPFFICRDVHANGLEFVVVEYATRTKRGPIPVNLKKDIELRTAETFPIVRLLVGAALALGLSCAAIADEPKAPAKPLDVKSTFRNICGFCHENYGRKAAKGPQLMNTERSDEFIFNRIKNGMPGRMASFGTAFTDDQIRDIVKFIRSLKPDQEPQNP